MLSTVSNSAKFVELMQFRVNAVSVGGSPSKSLGENKNSKYLDAGMFMSPISLAGYGAFVLAKSVSRAFFDLVCSTAVLRQIIPVLNLLCQVQIQECDPKSWQTRQ